MHIIYGNLSGCEPQGKLIIQSTSREINKRNLYQAPKGNFGRFIMGFALNYNRKGNDIMNILLEEKRELFNDLRIPWDNDIERQLKERIKEKPSADPAMLLDRIAHRYIEKAFENPMETYIAYLKDKHGTRPMSRRTLLNELGEEAFEELVNNGTLEPVRSYSYKLKGDVFHA